MNYEHSFVNLSITNLHKSEKLRDKKILAFTKKSCMRTSKPHLRDFSRYIMGVERSRRGHFYEHNLVQTRNNNNNNNNKNHHGS